MPIYEYKCPECEHAFETIQRPSQPDPDRCPECGHGEVRRLVSQSSFQLKGGGWFDDGYGSGPSANHRGDSPETGGSETTDTGGEESSDSGEGGADVEAAAE